MILPEYLDTLFLVPEPPAMGWPAEFAIITAANAFSAGSRKGDAQADISLRKDLSRLKATRIRGTGMSPDWKHREHGWAAWPLSFAQAVELSKKYRQNAFFVVEKDTLFVVSCTTLERQKLGSWRIRLRKRSDEPTDTVYVVELERAVLDVKRFRIKNAGHRPSMKCLYVGKTGRTPGERFKQHKEGYKSCSLVRKFGLRLVPGLFPTKARLSKAEATALEKNHAEALRAKGYAVWQN